MTRRTALTLAAAAPLLGAAKNPPPLPPIVTGGGTRLYPTGDPSHWWTTEPVSGWTLPHIVSLGATSSPDGATMLLDTRNTPLEGEFTRAYFQMTTRPLQGSQTLDGVFTVAIHANEWHRRIDAVLAVQVVVHRPDMGVRGVALAVTPDTLEFPLGNPPKTRAIVNWPLAPVACLDGDVIAVNLGLAADNQSNMVAQGVGLALYANQPADISRLDDPQTGNSWFEFSAPLVF